MHPIWETPPLDVLAAMRSERESLIETLRQCSDEDWSRPTVCSAWDVRGLVAHMVDTDLRVVSAVRDRHTGAWFTGPADELAAHLDTVNRRFVDAVPGWSGRVLTALLAASGTAVVATLASVDPMQPTFGVSWAGVEPTAPRWFGTAREYTEHWVHGRQVRLALGVPPLDDTAHLAPVIDTFRWCLPPALDRLGGPRPASVRVEIHGVVEREWHLARSIDGWAFVGGDHAVSGEQGVVVDEVVHLDALEAVRTWTAPRARLATRPATALVAVAAARAIVV